jgi:hypothetical protein
LGGGNLVLPFTKRTARDDHEVINTAEIEVLRSNSRPLRAAVQPHPRAQLPRRASNPTNPVRSPRATQPSASDEEMTRLVPRSIPSSSSSRRGWTTPPPAAGSSSSSPPSGDDDETLVLSPAAQAAVTISPFPSARAAEARARAVNPTKPAISPDSIPPMALALPAPAAAGTVITNRPRTPGRPTAIWTVALVAMGLFAGLASSVLARGDADSIIDATASFVDPARAGGTRTTPPVAAAQLSVAPTPLNAASPAAPIIGYVPPTPPAPVAQVAPATDKTVSATDLPTAPATASRDRLPPVAYATSSKAVAARPPVTARRTARWTAPPAKVTTNVASATEPKVADDAKDAKADAKTALVADAPAPKAGKAVRGKRHASDEDVASASAADELARAQLEAALR